MINNVGVVEQPAQPVPFERNLQNVSRKMEIEITPDGGTQVTVKDDNGKPVRYVPPIAFNDAIKLEYERLANNLDNFA